jgi:hypothetical protein
LTQPERRLGELDKIDETLRVKFRNYYDDIEKLKDVDIDSFKKAYAAALSKLKLNGAESSLINDLYKELNKNHQL